MVNLLDRSYAALADPTRRSLLEQLATGDLAVSELRTPHPMTLAAVGKHLGVLENAGIVTTRKTGRIRTCSLARDGLSEATTWLTRHETFWQDRLDSLTAHLERHP